MENQSEKIQEYIEGQLVGTDLIEFEAQLAVDDDLRNLLALQKEIHDILRKRVVNTDMELRGTLSSVSNNFRYNPNAKVINIRKLLSIVVAACVLIIGSIFIFNRSNDLYDLPIMHSEIVRGQEENVSYENAVKAFNAKDYKEARVQLESLLVGAVNQVQYEYYLALTYLGEEDWKQAIEQLIPIANGESVFADEAKYYLAIANIKIDNVARAKELLKELSAENELGEKAKKLLKMIN